MQKSEIHMAECLRVQLLDSIWSVGGQVGRSGSGWKVDGQGPVGHPADAQEVLGNLVLDPLPFPPPPPQIKFKLT